MKKPIVINKQKLTRESYLFSQIPMPKTKVDCLAKGSERTIESFNSHLKITWKDKK